MISDLPMLGDARNFVTDPFYEIESQIEELREQLACDDETARFLFDNGIFASYKGQSRYLSSVRVAIDTHLNREIILNEEPNTATRLPKTDGMLFSNDCKYVRRLRHRLLRKSTSLNQLFDYELPVWSPSNRSELRARAW